MGLKSDWEQQVNIYAWLCRQNGHEITVGFRQSTTDIMQIALTWYTPAEALLTASPRPDFKRILGQGSEAWSTNPVSLAMPGTSGDVHPTGYVATVTTDGHPSEMDKLSQGANYLSHWIFTPDAVSPTNTNEWYCYVVVEVATGVYRSLAFGEGRKLGGSGWDGGIFVSASKEDASFQSRSSWTLAGDHIYTGSDTGLNGYILNRDNDHYISTVSPNLFNPWTQMHDPFDANSVCSMGTGPRTMGKDLITRSPANFSGQSIRVPARFYCMNLQNGTGANRMRPLMDALDFFHVNISDMTPGETIVDDTESFLVVPYVAKTGTDNSGNFGFLIRNSNL